MVTTKKESIAYTQREMKQIKTQYDKKLMKQIKQ